MPGHRRENEPDDTTRVQDTAGGTSGDAHGSTAVHGAAPGSAAPSGPPLDQPTAREPIADQPTAVQPTGTGGTSTMPVTVPTPAAGHGAPGHPAPAEPPADQPWTSTAGRKEVVAAQRARYGGISWGSAFFGWLTANGMAVLLIALLSALGVALGLTSGLEDATEAAEQATSGAGLGAAIAILVALFLAYLAGGYVAGRMARFDGAKQGVAVWLVGLVVVLLLALAGLVFGSQYNVLSQLNLPRIPIDEGTATTTGMIALASILVATLVAAVLGGLMGARYHRKVDRVGFDH